MNEKELLELAAKAADISICEWIYDEQLEHWLGAGVNSEGATVYWNPILDDGEAFRLAVSLNMRIDILDFTGYAIAKARRPDSIECSEYFLTDFNGKKIDPCAATRVAIVRAAAEIGKMMLTNKQPQ